MKSSALPLDAEPSKDVAFGALLEEDTVTTITVQRKRKCRICGKRKPASGWSDATETIEIANRLRFITPSFICNQCAEGVEAAVVDEAPEKVPGAKGAPVEPPAQPAAQEPA